MKNQRRTNGKAKETVKTGNAKMKIDKIVTQQITQEQTGNLSNIKTKNLIIKEITIRETEKGSLEFRTTITNKEITME